MFDPYHGADFWCSWPLDTPEDKLRVMQCKSSECESAEAVLNQPVVLEGVFCHRYERVHEDGEVEYLTRTILCLKDGRRVGFVSKGVLSDLRMLLFLFPPPWGEGPEVCVKQVKVGENRRTYHLEVTRAPAAPGQKKGGRRAD